MVFTAAAGAPAALAEPVPPPPAVGDCVECQGLVNETLNACNLESASCISTLNDDAEHFEAPWEFDGDRATAVARLIEVATGAPACMWLRSPCWALLAGVNQGRACMAGKEC